MCLLLLRILCERNDRLTLPHWVPLHPRVLMAGGPLQETLGAVVALVPEPPALLLPESAGAAQGLLVSGPSLRLARHPGPDVIIIILIIIPIIITIIIMIVIMIIMIIMSSS